MKHFVTFTLLLGVLAGSTVGCKLGQPQAEAQAVKEADPQIARLSASLHSLIALMQQDFTQGGFVLYDAPADSIALLDLQGYAVFEALQQGLGKDSATVRVQPKKPDTEDWIFVGECDDKEESALLLLSERKKDLPAGRSVAFYVEPQEHSVYKVWYQPMP